METDQLIFCFCIFFIHKVGLILSAPTNERNVKPWNIVFKVSNKYEVLYKSQTTWISASYDGELLASWAAKLLTTNQFHNSGGV